MFFDWDKYNITSEGEQILEAAAAHYKAGGAVQIQVTGYTDLSGSPGITSGSPNGVPVPWQRFLSGLAYRATRWSSPVAV